MTTSGEPPTGARGVSEPDWIDQILERATNQVDAAATKRPSMPIVPEPEPEQMAAPAAKPKQRRAEPLVRRAPAPVDGLAEIRWAEPPQVTPASTPITAPPEDVRPAAATVAAPIAAAAAAPTSPAGLSPADVGRSAWDADLANLGEADPDGWEKLSWTDLDGHAPATPTPMPEPTTFGRLLREWGPVLVAAIAIALFTRLVLVQAYHIPSQSMVPTLHNGDRVVVNRLSYQFGEIERGQVVVFAKPPGTDGENDLIKRVIGLPGETVRFVDEQVYINGLRVEEPYLAQQNSTRPRLTIPGCAQVDPAADLCVIPEGYIFVMGDNRLGSSDSRVFGPVEVDSVVGRAFVRVWPLNNLGAL